MGKNARNIWIWNHYATSMFFDRGGRHYSFAKYLMRSGHNVTIFCANTIHGSRNLIDNKGKLYSAGCVDGIRFIFVRSAKYRGNGIGRGLNMLSFAHNVKKSAVEYAKLNGVPDILLASSVHLWTLSAGLATAKRFHIPCICEVRDLWPESLIDYGQLQRKSAIARYLYYKERRLYEKANQIIFTWEGAPQYIKDKGWDLESGGQINLKKVHYINNGVDLVEFDKNAYKHKGSGSELFLQDGLNFIYTGAIRKVNNLELIVKPFAEVIKEGLAVRLIVVGGGDQLDNLKDKYAALEESIVFTGRMDKEYIPALLMQTDVCVLCSTQVPLNRYGISQNKLFDYMAAGKPILSLVPSLYDPIEAYGTGLYSKDQSIEEVKNAIKRMVDLSEIDREEMGRAAREAAKDFDFPVLTEKLITVVESTATR